MSIYLCMWRKEEAYMKLPLLERYSRKAGLDKSWRNIPLSRFRACRNRSLTQHRHRFGGPIQFEQTGYVRLWSRTSRNLEDHGHRASSENIKHDQGLWSCNQMTPYLYCWYPHSARATATVSFGFECLMNCAAQYSCSPCKLRHCQHMDLDAIVTRHYQEPSPWSLEEALLSKCWNNSYGTWIVDATEVPGYLSWWPRR